MFLMPSRYEPCGLNQMYSLKYGRCPSCAPPAASTTPSILGTRAREREPASSFTEYSGEALLLTVKQALQAYRDQESWQTLMRNGMSKDFSWDASAREYAKVYEQRVSMCMAPRDVLNGHREQLANELCTQRAPFSVAASRTAAKIC